MTPTCLGYAIFALLVGAPLQQDAAERFWNQPRGNPEGTAAVDVEPVRSDPLEIWRLELGDILCEPVVWGETLYVAVQEKRTRVLLAISIADGEPVARVRLGSPVDFTHLAAWQGTVVAVEPKEVETYAHRASSLKMARRVKGAFLAQPCVARGHLFTTGPSGQLTCIDIARGKLLATASEAGYGRPAFLRDDVVALDVREQEGYRGEYLVLLRTPIDGLGERKVTFGNPYHEFSGAVRGSAKGRKHEGYVLAIVEGGSHVWYGRSPVPLKVDRGGTCPGALFGTGRLSTIASPPTVYEGKLFGFAEDGAFVSQLPDGRFRTVVKQGGFPDGAQAGPATRAGTVAYLGNWAVDLESGRVLWSLPELEAASPLLPVADDRIAYVSKAGELVCLGGATGVTASSAGAGTAERPTRPGTGDAVVLDDGRRVPGTVERRRDGAVHLVPEVGEPRTIEAASVSLVESGDAVELVGEEYPVLRAWLDALDAEVVDALEKRFEGYLKPRLISDCQRLLAEMRTRGVSSARAEVLEAQLAGKPQSTASNAQRQQRKQAAEEGDERRELAGEFVGASAWCQDRDLRTAATVLLSEAERLCPELEGLTARAEALVPPSFPWHGRSDTAELWMRWARELAPAGGRFVGRDDEECWGRVRGTIWSEDTLALSTRNLLVFSKSDEAAVVGSCLRNGEAAIRALEDLLGRAEGSDEPFEVRIHANQSEYLAERSPAGTFALPWSAGYYSPARRVSRFYVLRAGENREPLGRELHRVFAHELTHQYLSEAWLGSEEALGGRVNEPGYWVAEGIARFVEDQVVEMGRRGRRFDDVTVRSVDAVAQLAETGLLFPIEVFVDLTYAEFIALEDEVVADVQLRNTLQRVDVTRLSLFYEQAGCLVFFLVNHCGEEGREALVSYLRASYEGRARRNGWKALGFDSAQELEREFHAFLRELR